MPLPETQAPATKTIVRQIGHHPTTPLALGSCECSWLILDLIFGCSSPPKQSHFCWPSWSCRPSTTVSLFSLPPSFPISALVGLPRPCLSSYSSFFFVGSLPPCSAILVHCFSGGNPTPSSARPVIVLASAFCPIAFSRTAYPLHVNFCRLPFLFGLRFVLGSSL